MELLEFAWLKTWVPGGNEVEFGPFITTMPAMSPERMAGRREAISKALRYLKL